MQRKEKRMTEQTEQIEKNVITEKPVSSEKPKKIWDGALKMVRGENTAQLIEDFTAEMTLVAEGLCEDQSLLRKEVDRIIAQDDRRIQALQSRIEATETMLDEERTAHDLDVTELRNRIAALEKKASSRTEREKSRKGSVIRDLTVMVAIASFAWIVVTLMNKLL